MPPNEITPVSMSDEEFEATNITWQKMDHFKRRAKNVPTGNPKLLFGFGPQGIAKSEGLNIIFGDYVNQVKQRWEQQEPYERNQRRTDTDGLNFNFVSPVIKIGGKCTPIEMFIHLSDHNQPGEICLLDDLTTNAEIQRIIHQATDRTNGYLMSWDRITDIKVRDANGDVQIYPRRVNFYGSIVITSNEREGTNSFNAKFAKPLLDRGEVVHFPYDVDDRFIYTDRLAFVKGGILKYLMNPPPWGLGQVLTREEAIAILKDVREFYWEHRRRFREPSFRILEKVLSDRVGHRADWRRMALDHLS